MFSPKLSPQSKEYKKTTLVGALDDYATGVARSDNSEMKTDNRERLSLHVLTTPIKFYNVFHNKGIDLFFKVLFIGANKKLELLIDFMYFNS